MKCVPIFVITALVAVYTNALPGFGSDFFEGVSGLTGANPADKGAAEDDAPAARAKEAGDKIDGAGEKAAAAKDAADLTKKGKKADTAAARAKKAGDKKDSAGDKAAAAKDAADATNIDRTADAAAAKEKKGGDKNVGAGDKAAAAKDAADATKKDGTDAVSAAKTKVESVTGKTDDAKAALAATGALAAATPEALGGLGVIQAALKLYWDLFIKFITNIIPGISSLSAVPGLPAAPGLPDTSKIPGASSIPSGLPSAGLPSLPAGPFGR